MRVLIANTTCKVGGVSTFMLSLHAALRAAGHHAELFFFEHGPMERHLPNHLPVRFGTLSDALRLIQRERFDVVHANNIDWSSGIAAARDAGAKVVLTAHKIRPPAWTYGWTSEHCDALVAISSWVSRGLQPFTDVSVQTVPNGIDTAHFYPVAGARTEPPVVAWVGRSGAPIKRIDRLAAVAPALHRAGIRLWILDQQGPEAAAAAFPQAAETLRAIAEVWQGASFDAMPDLYRRIAQSGGAVLSTSDREGLGLAMIEAQACGCLAFAPDIPGINECVRPAHGGLLYPADIEPTQLAESIVSTLGDRDHVHRRQAQAAAHVRDNFSLDRMAERYLQIYRESPFPPRDGAIARIRARTRLSPGLHQREYLSERWGVGFRQYQASIELARSDDWALASAAARASFRTAPTIYIRPGRLAHLALTRLRAGKTDKGARVARRSTRDSRRVKGESAAAVAEPIVAESQPAQVGVGRHSSGDGQANPRTGL